MVKSAIVPSDRYTRRLRKVEATDRFDAMVVAVWKREEEVKSWRQVISNGKPAALAAQPESLEVCM